ncbi:MAG: hypothetical protein KF812_00225 [Fimbriimonadaceae bacterium]|nr:hypothetical protein [Fimbriimonadaceae bacterium]
MITRLLPIFAVTGLAATVAVPETLYVNGQKSTLAPIEKDGEVYVPLKSLRAAGAEVTTSQERLSIQFIPPKAQNEQPYVEAILGEWVNNGIWRFRVSNVAKITDPFGNGGSGYALDFEAMNVSPNMAQMGYTGVLGLQLLDTESTRFENTSGSFADFLSDIQPGGTFKNRIEFGNSGGATRGTDPMKLIIQFDQPAKSVRINLKPE